MFLRHAKRIRHRIRSLFHKQQAEDELDRELRSHLEAQIEEYRSHGMEAAEARIAARRALGGEAQIKEECRDMRRVQHVENIWRDLRYAARNLRQNPGFAAVAIVSLALGIGANTAIFSLIYALLLQSLPVHDPGSLLLVAKGSIYGRGYNYSYPAFRLLRDNNRTLSGIAAYSHANPRVAAEAGGEPVHVAAQYVSGAYFSLLGIAPVVGRVLGEQDDRSLGSHPVAVISYDYWQRQFGLDPHILGRAVIVDESPYTIVGVAPPGFSGTASETAVKLWLPAMMMKGGCITELGCQTFFLMARLRNGASVAQVRAELEVLHARHLAVRAAGIKNEFSRKQFLDQHIALVSGATGFSSLGYEFARPLYVLMAAVGIVLLIACANVANLLLARATTRQREVALRLAIGAGRARLIRQFLTESMLLACAASLLGVALAYWCSTALVGFLPARESAVALDLRPNAAVLAFTFAIAAGSVLLFGLVPALKSSRADVAGALKESSAGIPAARGRLRLARSLVVAQIALSVLLLVGAGLFVRSLHNLHTLDAGFASDHVLMFEADGPQSWKTERTLSAAQQALVRLQSLPGVLASGSGAPGVLIGSNWDNNIAAEGYVPRPDEDLDTNLTAITPGFFEALHTPLLSGRLFDEHDQKGAPKVALVNRTLTEYFFRNRNPLGKHLDVPEIGNVEIVGVVQDSRLINLKQQVPRMIFFPQAQIDDAFSRSFVIRTAAPPEVIAPALRRLLHEIDPGLQLSRLRTLDDQIDSRLSKERLIATLSSAFGALAVLLAAVGLYGTMSYAVARRTSEIGVRMAIGAGPQEVLRLILGETFLLILLGLAVGVPVSIACARALLSLLFGLKPADPITLGAVVTLLAAVGLLASWLPARRAIKVDPLVALRHD